MCLSVRLSIWESHKVKEIFQSLIQFDSIGNWVVAECFVKHYLVREFGHFFRMLAAWEKEIWLTIE